MRTIYDAAQHKLRVIQILSGPRSARDARAFTDPTAVVVMTFSGSGRHGGTRDSFDEAEARPAPGSPARVGSTLATPVKIVDVPAILPVQAQQAGVRGMVLVEVHLAADGTVVQGDTCAAHCHAVGRHVGTDLGGPATGAPVDFWGITILRAENGRIVEGWNSFDFLSMYQQIGWVANPVLPGQP